MTKVAFILAAGLGSRMSPLTKTTPKPLLRIKGKPLIKFTLDLLKSHGFTNIGVNIFHHANKLEKFLKKTDLQIVKEKALSGTAGGVLEISKKMKPDSPFLVIAPDMLINFDLSKIYKFHLKHKGSATVCCYFRPKSALDTKKSGQVVFDKKTGKIKHIAECRDKIISRWVNSSIYIFSPEVITLIKGLRVKQPDIPTDLIPLLLNLDKQVYAYPINSKKFYQLGIDTPGRIKIAEADIDSGKFLPTIP